MQMLLTMWYSLQARAKAGAEALKAESGQDFIEYALILGVITLVIILAFLTTGIEDAVADLAEQVACEISGGDWTAASGTTPGSCGG